jgi:hypothetical protein
MAFAGNYIGIDYGVGYGHSILHNTYLEKEQRLQDQLKQALSFSPTEFEPRLVFGVSAPKLDHSYDFKVVRTGKNEFKLFSRSVWRYHDSL